MSKFPMTVQGARALEEEVKHLKGVLRPQISQAIVEARIRDIEAKLSNAQVIDVTAIPHSGKVIFGTTVDIANVETDETVTYQIVGDDEADIKGGKISVNSPIARALIGKTEGDAVLVRTPGGDVEYEIVEVRHI